MVSRRGLSLIETVLGEERVEPEEKVGVLRGCREVLSPTRKETSY